MLLENPKHLAKTLDILLFLQIVVYGIVSGLSYQWRSLDPLISVGKVQIVETLVAIFVVLACCSVLLLAVGLSDATNKKSFLKPHRMILIGVVVILAAVARLVVSWIDRHTGVMSGGWPFIP